MPIYTGIDVMLTQRCNARCKNCIEHCNLEDITGLEPPPDLTMKQLARMIVEIQGLYQKKNEQVTEHLVLTGGEPTLSNILEPALMMIKDCLVDNGIIGRVQFNSNLINSIPLKLEKYVVNYETMDLKPKHHQAAFLHPIETGNKPTYQTCQHYRKSNIVLSYHGWSTCCAADAYIKLFALEDLFVTKLPDKMEDFPLDKMDQVCQHCPFGGEKEVKESDVGRPVSKIYLDEGKKNREGRQIRKVYGL